MFYWEWLLSICLLMMFFVYLIFEELYRILSIFIVIFLELFLLWLYVVFNFYFYFGVLIGIINKCLILFIIVSFEIYYDIKMIFNKRKF